MIEIRDCIELCKSQAEKYTYRAEYGISRTGKEANAQVAAKYSQIMQWLMGLEERRKADVPPVKHGRWENTSTPNQLRCSECDVIHFIAQYPKGEINYCPNCGADMRGDTK